MARSGYIQMKKLRKWIIGLLILLPGVACAQQFNWTNSSTWQITNDTGFNLTGNVQNANITPEWGNVQNKTTTGLTEGTNLYYTTARTRGDVNATDPITLTTGTFGFNSTLKSTYDGYATSKLDAARGNWKVFYSNDTGVFTELSLGADGTYLKSNGATSAPSFAAISVGGGNVSQSAAVTAENITSWSADNVVKDGGKTVASLLTTANTTSHLGEGTNLYFTNGRADDRINASSVNSKGFTYYNITNASDFNFDISLGAKNITAVYMLCNGGTNVTGVLEKHDINGTFLAAVNSTAWVAVNNTGLWITSFGNATMIANETLYWNSTSVNGAPTFFTIKVYYGN